MKNQYPEAIAAILAGSSMNAEAKKLGIHMNILRRILIEHPDYESAKAAGKLRQKISIQPKLAALSKTSPAIDEVLAGATIAATAVKYGIPPTSLSQMVKIAHPGTSVRYRGLSALEVAELNLRKAEKALAKAKALSGEPEQPRQPRQPLKRGRKPHPKNETLREDLSKLPLTELEERLGFKVSLR